MGNTRHGRSESGYDYYLESKIPRNRLKLHIPAGSASRKNSEQLAYSLFFFFFKSIKSFLLNSFNRDANAVEFS